jgi:hypothetical protein
MFVIFQQIELEYSKYFIVYFVQRMSIDIQI